MHARTNRGSTHASNCTCNTSGADGRGRGLCVKGVPSRLHFTLIPLFLSTSDTFRSCSAGIPHARDVSGPENGDGIPDERSPERATRTYGLRHHWTRS
eukprot:3084228-Pyramimonas_sp.AAC.3